jgi:hypothetical protein
VGEEAEARERGRDGPRQRVRGEVEAREAREAGQRGARDGAGQVAAGEVQPDDRAARVARHAGPRAGGFLPRRRVPRRERAARVAQSRLRGQQRVRVGGGGGDEEEEEDQRAVDARRHCVLPGPGRRGDKRLCPWKMRAFLLYDGRAAHLLLV